MTKPPPDKKLDLDMPFDEALERPTLAFAWLAFLHDPLAGSAAQS